MTTPTKYTGKSAGTTAGFSTLTVWPGWREIVITEKGAPATGTLDVTVMGDTSYQFVDDPLGGQGSPSCQVTISGFLSQTSHNDTGIQSLVVGASGTLTVTTAASGDEWTQANMVYKTLDTSYPVAGVVPYTATFTHSTLAGAWSTDVP